MAGADPPEQKANVVTILKHLAYGRMPIELASLKGKK